MYSNFHCLTKGTHMKKHDKMRRIMGMKPVPKKTPTKDEYQQETLNEEKFSFAWYDDEDEDDKYEG